MATVPLTDEQIAEAVAASKAHPTKREAAASLKLTEGAYYNRLRAAASRGLMLDHPPAMPGFEISKVTTAPSGKQHITQKPEHGEVFELPKTHRVGKITVNRDADGRVIQDWLRAELNGAPSIEDTVAFLKGAFADVKPAEPIAAPPAPSSKLCTLIPCNDWHVRLLTWSRETGTNWDLKIAEREIGGAITDVIERSPSSDTAVVLGGGDLMHADTDQNRTEKSGNVLDADGRHGKGIEVAQRLKVRTIDAALARNKHVIVRILKGNHDEYSAGAIAYFLLAWYRNEPRVTVDVDQSLYWWFRFGKVLLGATHGHTVKLKDMAQIMAHRRAEDWGKTKFRYAHGFHIHHYSKFASEGGGVISESHQAPIPPDAWHFGAGYLSGRSVQTITYHADFGEISRSRTAILDAKEAA